MNDRELMQQALDALNHVNVQDRVQVITALRERLAQPEQEPVAWIKCSERLPQNKRAVLVFSPSNRCIFCAYFDVWWWYFGDSYQSMCRVAISRTVTHWRPLPPLPRSE